MGEIIDFPKSPKSSISSAGRMLLILEEQSQAQRMKLHLNSRRPSLVQSAVAKKELNFLFNGENAEVATEQYRQGLEDVVARRQVVEKRKVRILFHDDFVVATEVEAHRTLLTDSALFYIHVENLIATAAANDHLPNHPNTARLDRVRVPTIE